MQSFLKQEAYFKVWLDLYTFPNNWGLQTECKVQNRPRALIIPLVTWYTKAGPLSLSRDPIRANLGISLFSNASATSAAISVLVGNASVHLKKCPLAPGDAWSCPCSQYDSVINLPVLSGYVPLVWMGLYVGVSHVGVVTFHAKSYHDLN